MDRIEAQRNIDLYKQKINQLQQYNHLYSSAMFKRACDQELRAVKERLRYLENQMGK